MKTIQVSNLLSASGNPTPNQFEIITSEGIYFQSYKTVIAFKRNDGKIILNTKYDFSNTTGKFRNYFLGDSGIDETRKKVSSGEYTLEELN